MNHARNSILSFAVLFAFALDAGGVAAQSRTESTSRPVLRLIALTEADVKAVIRLLSSHSEGQRLQLHSAVDTEHLTPERFQVVLSAIYVLLVDLKYEEIKKRRNFWLTRWLTSSPEDKTWLIETKPQIDSHVTQLFGERGVQYTAAKRLVKTNRKALEQIILYLKPCK